MNKETLDKALDQWYWIERYLDKSWLDQEMPNDAICELLSYAVGKFHEENFNG